MREHSPMQDHPLSEHKQEKKKTKNFTTSDTKLKNGKHEDKIQIKIIQHTNHKTQRIKRTQHTNRKTQQIKTIQHSSHKTSKPKYFNIQITKLSKSKEFNI
jgi:hypothetical protein